MSRFIRSLCLALILPVMSGCAKAAPKTHQPIVVELFTSQGCSSCPPANATLNQLADRKDVLALSFGVVYWDYLGWKDTFASQANTRRQYDYAKGLHHDGVFTPQMIVNGRRDTTGQSPSIVTPLIEAAKKDPPGPAISLGRDKVTIAAAGSQPATVWLVRYDPRVVQVPINRGENAGRTLPHRNVVRELIRLGAFSGQTVDFTLPKASMAGLRTAVLVQSGTGGPVLSAATD
jgi:hypothetical protein